MKFMRDILIIAHFASVPGEFGNNRFNHIANMIDKNKARVELVTSSFSHNRKIQREINSINGGDLSYKISMVYEPNYKKNVSIMRFYSHYKMSSNLNKYLYQRKKPDVIYCATPSLCVAKVAADYANKNKVRFIIDIQDLWPEAFKMVFNIPLISDLALYPIKKKADYIYSTADDIVAVSETYANRGMAVNNKCEKPYVVYLGTDLANFDRLSKQYKINRECDEEIWIAYIGTLGHSYDLINTIDALKIINDKGIDNIQFIIMGDGPLRSKFEYYAKQQGVNCNFTGRLDYGKMVGILKSCDMAVNPITKGAAQSIINKHADYAAAGLPVINTQECSEYRNLVDKYSMGFNCENNNPKDMAEKIYTLYKDIGLRERMGNNSRRLAKEQFDRGKTYITIVNILKP